MKKMIFSLIAGVMLLGLTACGGSQNMQDFTAEYDDSVFIGDSVTEGFKFNEILPEENVMAGAGATVGFTFEDLDTLIERAPKRVYILLGQCDLLMPVDDPLQLFQEDYRRYIQTIQEKLPDCKIYLQSITNVSKSALAEEPRYEQIGIYNGAIKELAREMSVTYVGLDKFADEHNDLYAEDGIHFEKEFYSLWLEFLMKQD